MRTSSVGALVLLGLILVIFLVGLRNRRAGKDLLAYLQASGFSPAASPVAAPFTYTDMTQVDAYQGELRSGVPAHVLLGRRRGTAVLVNNVPTASMEDYISLYLPPAAAAEARRRVGGALEGGSGCARRQAHARRAGAGGRHPVYLAQ